MAHAIEIDDVALRIVVREQGKRRMNRLRPGVQRVGAILTDADHLGVEIAEALQFGLVGGELRRADAAEREWDKGEHNILLASKIAQTPILLVRRLQGKIWSGVSNLQCLCLCAV